MRVLPFIILPASLILLSSTCNKVPPTPEPDMSAYEGLVINEIAAHDQTVDAVSWVELLNAGAKEVSLDGLGLFITDEYFNGRQIFTGSGSLAAGERLLVSTADGSLTTGIASNAQFILRLGTKEGTVDAFDRSADCEQTLYDRGSFQRIPDGTATWKALPYNSKGKENQVFDLNAQNHTAIWVWNSHIPSWLEDDCKSMKNLYSLGYRHILLNAAAFSPSNKRRTLQFMEAAEEMGWTIHAWMQCFYNGGWVSPVDDENKCYREDIYERIRTNARSYVEEYGVKGLHLDYIRFGGTAYKHNPSTEVNAIGAVNRCCREIREIADSFDAGIVTSAALMPEINSTEYYGQSPSQMGKYLHILMPMIYRYSYGYSDASCQRVANWFADNSGDAQMWSGIQTYIGNDDHVDPMNAEQIRKDIDLFMDTRGNGIVLFRYGLGTFPDVNDIK